MSAELKTPRIRRILAENSALEIPPSPCLKNLGFGTGMFMFFFVGLRCRKKWHSWKRCNNQRSFFSQIQLVFAVIVKPQF
jgi:hypothetical protein